MKYTVKMDFEKWKTQNEKQLICDFVEDYEDQFEEYCKTKYEPKNKKDEK